MANSIFDNGFMLDISVPLVRMARIPCDELKGTNHIAALDGASNNNISAIGLII